MYYAGKTGEPKGSHGMQTSYLIYNHAQMVQLADEPRGGSQAPSRKPPSPKTQNTIYTPPPIILPKSRKYSVRKVNPIFPQVLLRVTLYEYVNCMHFVPPKTIEFMYTAHTVSSMRIFFVMHLCCMMRLWPLYPLFKRAIFFSVGQSTNWNSTNHRTRTLYMQKRLSSFQCCAWIRIRMDPHHFKNPDPDPHQK